MRRLRSARSRCAVVRYVPAFIWAIRALRSSKVGYLARPPDKSTAGELSQHACESSLLRWHTALRCLCPLPRVLVTAASYPLPHSRCTCPLPHARCHMPAVPLGIMLAASRLIDRPVQHA